jgi:hypothetical protein
MRLISKALSKIMSYFPDADRNLNTFPSALGNNCECGGFLVMVGRDKETGRRVWQCGTCNRYEER